MKTYHDQLMEDPEFRRLATIENLAGDASDLVARLMHDQKLSKADLARRMNKSRAFVTQLLSGRQNMTIRTLAEVLFHLDSEVKLHVQPTAWVREKKRPEKGPGGGSETYVIDAAAHARGIVFTLKSDVLENTSEEPELQREQPEYAA